MGQMWGWLKAIGTNSPMMSFGLKVGHLHQPMLTASWWNTLGRMTLVGIWLKHFPESKVGVGKCDMHYTKSICCTTWSCLAFFIVRPRFIIWLQAIDIEVMTFPWRTLDAQEFHRLQKPTSSFPPHCHMTLVTKGMLAESNSLYSRSGWCMGRHSFSSSFFFWFIR